VHYLHELPSEDEERLEKVFKKLDVDNNGRIDIHDLSKSLKEFGLSANYAEVSKRSSHTLFVNLNINICKRLLKYL
jgi:Ca2+-binding EF-hand superfamily protein